MKITIQDQKLLNSCCEQLITYSKTIEKLYAEYLTIIHKRALNVDESLNVVRSALRIEQIVFRTLPIQQYMKDNPEEFTGSRADWVAESKRIETLYHNFQSEYLSKLLPHAIDILDAYDTSVQTPKIFAADSKLVREPSAKGEPSKGKSIVPLNMELEHRLFKVSTCVAILKEVTRLEGFRTNNISSSSNRPASHSGLSKSIIMGQLHGAQLQVNSFILRGKTMDRILLNDLDVYAQRQYRVLLNKHQPMKIWLEILSEATVVAQQYMRNVLRKMEVREQQIEQAERLAVKMIVSAFCSPANNMVDPVFNLFKAISDNILLGKKILAKSPDASTAEQLQAFINSIFKSKDNSDPLSKMVKTMESNPPNTTLELMKKYLDYKIEAPRVFAEMFQHDTKVWQSEAHDEDPYKPESIINAKRRDLMQHYKFSANQRTWSEYYSANKYIELFSKVNDETWKAFKETVDSIFKIYADQYIPAKGLSYVTAYIQKNTFDDNKSGLASFDKTHYEAIIDSIANELALSGLVRYGITYEPGWGGTKYPTEKQLDVINQGQFELDMNGSTAIAQCDILNQAIYACYLKSQPKSTEHFHNPFLDKDMIDDMRCKYFKARYTPQQTARFNKMKAILFEYYKTPIDARIFRCFESQPQVSALKDRMNHVKSDTQPDQGSLNPTAQAIDKIHHWKSAHSLRVQSQEKLLPFILSLRADIQGISQERTFARTHLFYKIDLIRRTELNRQIVLMKEKSTSTSTSPTSSVGEKHEDLSRLDNDGGHTRQGLF